MTNYAAYNPYCMGWSNPLGVYPSPSNNFYYPLQNKEKDASDPFPLLRQFQKIEDIREDCLNFPIGLTPRFIKAAYIKPPGDKAAQKELEESTRTFNEAESLQTEFKSPLAKAPLDKRPQAEFKITPEKAESLQTEFKSSLAKAPLDKRPQVNLEDDLRSLKEEVENVPVDILLKSEPQKNLLTKSDFKEMKRYNPIFFRTMNRILNVAESLHNKEIEKEYELKQEELRILDLITEKEWDEEEREADRFTRSPVIRDNEPRFEIKKEEVEAFSSDMKINKDLSLQEAMAERRKSFEYEEDEGFESNEFSD
ncbi:hypothetical protein [Criblamydia sequanensis]|uniref:Uncharacterized protein n=1 Tax=Candidatus Criblamydia sequanensis CRIB-18 TaxID=1437425 RepID=A0A090CYT0_9BACT|nr:hypothetical protein [Criblamydia sequanensis]CDR33857.1 hypothetical protein CSEC_1031 [Criblamydia sequanensis CRIB-18]